MTFKSAVILPQMHENFKSCKLAPKGVLSIGEMIDLEKQFHELAVYRQLQQTQRALDQCNKRTEKVGLYLSAGQIERLASSRFSALQKTGRMEFGEGILPKLIHRFLDSPYLIQSTYEQTLTELQELFYELKNETKDRLSDDELLTAMRAIFDGRAQGSVEFIAGQSLEALTQAARGEHMNNMYDSAWMDWEEEDE